MSTKRPTTPDFEAMALAWSKSRPGHEARKSHLDCLGELLRAAYRQGQAEMALQWARDVIRALPLLGDAGKDPK